MRTINITLLFAVILSSSLCFGAPERRKNSQRYAEPGIKNAQGRSGAASLMGRILYSKDGSSLVELTTGELDSPTAPGTISKVQLKAFGANKAVNYGNYKEQESKGQWQLALKDFRPGQKIQVQANIRDVDPTRTDVVTLDTTVARRPDVRVVSIDAPLQTRTSSAPITFVAQIKEFNGHVGQTTDCVLYVNGVRTDSANAIWVAAGDTVACAFSRYFPLPGTYTLRVAVENGTPYDDDSTNNSTVHALNVVAGSDPTSWNVVVYGRKDQGWSRDDGQYRGPAVNPTLEQDWGSTTEWNNRYNTVNTYISTTGRLTFPGSATIRHIVGSTLAFEGTVPLPEIWANENEACGENWIGDSIIVNACSFDFGPYMVGTNAWVQVLYGRAFYHSVAYDRLRNIDNPGTNYDTTNVWSSTQEGIQFDWFTSPDPTLTFSTVLSGSNGVTASAIGTVKYVVNDGSFSNPKSCFTADPATGNRYVYCSESQNSGSYFQAEAAGVTN